MWVVSQKSCDTSISDTHLTVFIQAVFSLTAVGMYPSLGIWLLFKRYSSGLVLYFVLGTDTGRSIRLPSVAVVTKCKSICSVIPSSCSGPSLLSLGERAFLKCWWGALHGPCTTRGQVRVFLAPSDPKNDSCETGMSTALYQVLRECLGDWKEN